MTCYHPRHGYRGVNGQFTTNKNASPTRAPMVAPCGGCIGCRLSYARDWAVRLCCEAQLHEDATFVTLTFDDEHLPSDYSVHRRDMQLFMKRLRDHLWRNYKIKIRFFGVAEYGDKNLRPHYHILIFGYGFPDRWLWARSPSGKNRYRSPELEKLWKFGFCELGSVELASINYVARYAMKKLGGDMGKEHYRRVHPLTGDFIVRFDDETGEAFDTVEREFALMSRRPGIGGDWYDLYKSDAFPSDFLVFNGKKFPIPKYFDKKLKDSFELFDGDADGLIARDDHSVLKRMRQERARGRLSENSPERLSVKEEVRELAFAGRSRELG